MSEGSEQHFSNAERAINPEFYIQKKYPSEMKGKSRHQAYLKIMAIGSSLNRKEVIKKGVLEHQEGRKKNPKSTT